MYSCTQPVLCGETKKWKGFIARRKSCHHHPGIKAGESWETQKPGTALGLRAGTGGGEGGGGGRRLTACLPSSQPCKTPRPRCPMARSKATLCQWLGCPGLLGCFLLGFLAGEYRGPRAPCTVFARCGLVCAPPVVINSPSRSLRCFSGHTRLVPLLF